MAANGMHDPSRRQGETTLPAIRIREERSGLSVAALLIEDRAPANAAFLWQFFATPRAIPAIHAMWTGPEISAPIPDSDLTDAERAAGVPLENATIMPQPGDVVLTFLPPRVWGGGPAPVFDIGIFYGPGARLFFPIGWQPGSIVAHIADVAPLAAACRRIRHSGACTLLFARDA